MDYKLCPQAHERIKNIMQGHARILHGYARICTDVPTLFSPNVPPRVPLHAKELQIVQRFQGGNGGRTRDRTLDLSRVKSEAVVRCSHAWPCNNPKSP